MTGGPYIEGVYLNAPLPEGSYLSALPAVRAIGDREHRLKLGGPVTFLVGENGSGKSTILEAIAVASGFNAEGGTRSFRFSTEATHSELCQYLTVSRRAYPKDGFFLRAESFYNMASYIDRLDREPGLGGQIIDSYGGRSLHCQSHGESFLALVQNRFRGEGLYLLDEPEAALSPSRQLTLLCEIHRLVEAGSQFIIATHSPVLMAYPEARILLLDERGIHPAAYRDTEHYQLTKMFLDNPERMIKRLFIKENNNG